MKKTTFSAEETIEFAVQIGKMLKKGDVIAYTGGLGSRQNIHLPEVWQLVWDWRIT